MKVSVWNSFSCNNSSSYYLVAEFGSPKEADKIAKEVDGFLKTHAKQKDGEEDWDYETPSAIQTKIEKKYGFSFGDYVHWGDGELVGDEPTVGVNGTQVVFAHGYCGGLDFIESMVKARGAKDTTGDSGDATIGVMLTVADSAAGKKVIAELTKFFAQEPNDFSDWKPGPWKSKADLPYAEVSEDVTWWTDGKHAGFHIPLEPELLGPINDYVSKSGVDDSRVVICDPKLQSKLKTLSNLGDCPECKSAKMSYYPADDSIEEDQMLCGDCGGMFSLSTMELNAPVINVCSGRLSSPCVVGETVFAANKDGSVWKLGKKWKKLDKGDGGLIYVHTTDGKTIVTTGYNLLRVSTDGGKTWTKKKTKAKGWLFHISASPNGTLFVGAAGGILRSQNGGNHWKLIDVPGPQDVMCVAAPSDEVLYACTRDARMLRSTDGGDTWKGTKTGGKKPLCRVVARSETSAVVVGDAGQAYSTTDGKKWVKRSSKTKSDIEDLIIGNDNRYYAIDSGGRLLISNNGSKWEAHATRTREHMWGLCTTPSGTLLAVGNNGTVARIEGFDRPEEESSLSGTRLATVGKTFVFTGKLRGMSRGEAGDRAKQLGGSVKSSVTKDLDYLVIGDEGSPLFGEGKKGAKMLAAEKLIAAGAELQILSESAFAKLSHTKALAKKPAAKKPPRRSRPRRSRREETGGEETSGEETGREETSR